MNTIDPLEKLIWFGFASVGFAVLFNVPLRTIPVIWFMGALCGGLKLLIIALGGEVILASLAGATLTGFISIWAAHTKHSPPMVFAIPAVIPLVPGVFAYHMMLGLMKLATTAEQEGYSDLLNHTISNGLKTLFVLMSLAIGVSIPMLITRRDTAKEIRMPTLRDRKRG